MQLTKLCRLTTMRSDARSKIHVWGTGNVSVKKLHGNRTKTERSGNGMTNADWWARVVQTRARHDDLLSQRVWTLRKSGDEAVMGLRAVPGVGAEIVLSVDGELRRTRCIAHTSRRSSQARLRTRGRRLRRRGGRETTADQPRWSWDLRWRSEWNEPRSLLQRRTNDARISFNGDLLTPLTTASAHCARSVAFRFACVFIAGAETRTLPVSRSTMASQ
jgi:hypothetical protein